MASTAVNSYRKLNTACCSGIKKKQQKKNISKNCPSLTSINLFKVALVGLCVIRNLMFL